MKNHCLKIFIVFGCMISACGKHEQSLDRVMPLNKIVDTEEKDSKKILISAINSGDLEKVKSSLAVVGDVNTYSEDGFTLIMIALRAEQFAVVEYLVGMNADLELKTKSVEINPDKSAREIVETMPWDDEIKSIYLAILNKEDFDVSRLNEYFYPSITFGNIPLIEWLLAKGADPNTIRKTGSGKEKDCPLIYLFSIKGVDGKKFENLKKIFDILVSHPNINVNLKVNKQTPLGKALKRLEDDNKYLPMVTKLKKMGAKE